LKKLSDEILFQYIDNELSEIERLKVEESLQTSAELRMRVDELKNVIRIPKYIQPLEPSLYFAQRLLEHKIKSKRGFRFKKYVPVFTIVILTAALMLFYKYNISDVDKIVKESESNLLSYYTKNLKPLFVNTRLDADDVFNFAFDRVVPLDREKNQYLSIGVNEKGREYFEIRNNLDIKNLHSKDEFVNKMKLNENQKTEFDKILNSYAENLESQVVLSEDNVIGVNENLWTLNRAITANVLQFAENASSKNLHQIVTPPINFVNNPKVDDLIRFAINNKSNRYVLLTPDTIVSTPIEINIEKFEKERKELENQKEKLVIAMKDETKKWKLHEDDLKKLSKELENLKITIRLDTSAKVYKKYKHKTRPFRIEIDEEKFHIEIPEIDKIDIPNIDSILMNIDIARNKIHSFKFKTPGELKHPSKEFKFDIEVLDDSLKKLEMQIPIWLEWELAKDSLKKFKMKIDGIDTLIKKSLDGFDSRDWEKFGKQMDSLGRYFEFKFDGRDFDKEKFKEQREKLKEQIEKLKYEYRYELKPKERKKKPEEI
jgi:hypothetical protein